jgi:hypothetical protein
VGTVDVVDAGTVDAVGGGVDEIDAVGVVSVFMRRSNLVFALGEDSVPFWVLEVIREVVL